MARARQHAWPLTLVALFGAALVLRLWGFRHGLPFVYNVDEQAHFVPRAIGFFGHDYDPRYFVNPPAYTYLVHGVLWTWFGGGESAARSFAADPTEAFAVARAASAVLGALAVVLTALAAARLFADRRTGALAGGLLAVAFLPVFYGHLALNDAPALAPVALSLYGAAGVLRSGHRRDYAIAGLGFGLAAATKYTAGIVVVCLIAAAVLAPRDRGQPLKGLALGLLVALAAFVAANPYAVLDPDAFARGISRQSHATGSVEKLGVTDQNGWRFYLDALTWGLGWLPALAAAAGAIALAARRGADRRAAWVLVPAAIGFLVFMGSQERYFGRWLLPVLPLVCALAAVAVVRGADALAARARRPALAAPALALAAAALATQGLVHSVHSNLALARPDTRELTRDWMDRNVARGARIVLEPVTADGWADGRWVDIAARDQPIGERATGGVNRRLPLRRAIGARPLVRLRRSAGVVGGESYQRTLSPGLIDRYLDAGACWVITGSTQQGRGQAQPERVPQAIAYYAALAKRARLAYRVRPEKPGRKAVPFDFDFAFNTYPLAYERPGPAMSVYHLRDRRCPRGAGAGRVAGARRGS